MPRDANFNEMNSRFFEGNNDNAPSAASPRSSMKHSKWPHTRSEQQATPGVNRTGGRPHRDELLYLEGYLWDPPGAREAMRRAIEIAKDAGRAVALSLSDPFCVDRHRTDFLDLVDNDVDNLFANELELTSLYGTDDLDKAFNEVVPLVKVAAVTRGEHGAVVVGDGEVHVVVADPATQVVDTTGAGDLFAAGFLAGWTQGRNLHDCGRMGAVAAAEVISHLGARPAADIKALMAERVPA